MNGAMATCLQQPTAAASIIFRCRRRSSRLRMPLRRARRHRLVPVDIFTQLTSTLETAVRERSFGALDVDRPSRATDERLRESRQSTVIFRSVNEIAPSLTIGAGR